MKRIYTLKSIRHLPEVSGIYKFGDSHEKVIYIGKAINLKRRVSSYFQNKNNLDLKSRNLVSQIRSIEIIPALSEFEALLLESKLIKQYLPKYNIILKDDKHFIYLKITKEEYPRILFARKNDDPYSLFYGPFPSKRVVRDVLFYIRKIFPYCNAKISPRPCFYTHIGLCNPCPSYITKCPDKDKKKLKNMYKFNISRIKKILSGKISAVQNELLNQMAQHSERQDFEKAAILRDRIKNLRILQTQYRPSTIYIENPDYAEQTWNNESRQARDLLREYMPNLKKLNKLEAYDISNISGKFATGSLVTFKMGIPDKNAYRKFKIKNLNKPDDFAMITQVLTRRLNHHKWKLPDLIIIDGGVPQLIAVGKLFKLKNISLPFIGIAKKYEELIIPFKSEFRRIKLAKSSVVLQLFQRIRDEAHRFAHKYHQNIRLRGMISEFEH